MTFSSFSSRKNFPLCNPNVSERNYVCRFYKHRKAVKTIQDHSKTDEKRLRAITLLFLHVHQLSSTSRSKGKSHCSFVVYWNLLNSVWMIMECGACLGLKLKYFPSELFFCLFLLTLGKLFPPHTSLFHSKFSLWMFSLPKLTWIFFFFFIFKEKKNKNFFSSVNVISKNFHLNQSFSKEFSSGFVQF